MTCGCGNTLITLTCFSLVLTNRSEYILIKLGELCPNRPISHDGSVSESNPTSCNSDVSPVQSSGGFYVLRFGNQRTCFPAPTNFSNEIISGNLVKCTSLNNISHYAIRCLRLRQFKYTLVTEINEYVSL